jgi:hypothetical protein
VVKGVDSRDAPYLLGADSYIYKAVMDVINSHADRLRRVIELANRDDRAHESVSRLMVQLAHFLLLWSCNAQDVHMLTHGSCRTAS